MKVAHARRWWPVLAAIVVPVVSCFGLTMLLSWLERVEERYADAPAALRESGFGPAFEPCLPQDATDVRIVWDLDTGHPSVRFTPVNGLPGGTEVKPLSESARARFATWRPPYTPWWNDALGRGQTVEDLEGEGFVLLECGPRFFGAAKPGGPHVYLWQRRRD